MAVFTGALPVYKIISTPPRTVRPWGLVDVQALPPWGWCTRCGGEVYRVADALCRRCRKEGSRANQTDVSW